MELPEHTLEWLLDYDGGLGVGKAVLFVRVRPVPQLAGGDEERPGQPLELSE